MHEMGIISGVIDAVTESARAAGATKVDRITLSIGEMTEVIMDCLTFAFEALSEGTMCEGAKLEVNIVKPRSICLDCANEFTHDRFHLACPQCGSYETVLIEGREMSIDAIEVDVPSDNTAADDAGPSTRPTDAAGCDEAAAPASVPESGADVAPAASAASDA